MGRVKFEWPYDGQNVQVAGTFSHWKPLDMTRNSGNNFALTLNIVPGNHEYKFIVDGNWVHCDLLPTRQNEMGSLNNFLDVGEDQDGQPSCQNKNSTSGGVTPTATPTSDSDWELVESNFEETLKEQLNEVAREAKSEVGGQRLSGADASKKATIEVERKFNVPVDYENRLREAGFIDVLELDEVLNDKYFDTTDRKLLRNDHWLRQRNGDWELKYPVGTRSQQKTTIYHETSSPEDILLKLNPILAPAEDYFMNLSQMLEQVKIFVTLETFRRCFVKDNVNVVIDTTNWDYRVGEIEVIISNNDQLMEAHDAIDKVSKELGFATVLEGKLHSYLKTNDPEAYIMMMSNHNQHLEN